MAMGLDKACEFVRGRLAQGSRRRFLAERVETEDEFHQARHAGFTFFQGYFSVSQKSLNSATSVQSM